jgi:hypothetical protein
LVKLALRERWVIPPEVRAALIERLGRIVQDSTASPREVRAACRLIATARKLNLDHTPEIIKADTLDDVERRLDAVERRATERMDG